MGLRVFHVGNWCAHWGVNFMKWEQYDRFWQQVFAPTGGRVTSKIFV